MPEASDQRDLLIRYLLGVASDTERLAIEEEVFAPDADFDVLLQAEDELIDDYVRGALSTSDRRLFESNFLCTEERRQRLEMVESFVQALAQTHSEKPVSSRRSFDRSLPLQERGRSIRPLISQTQLALASFNELLGWLDPDPERAAQKYEIIRSRLIRFFVMKGFNNAEELADTTFDRVASKVGQLVETYVGDPASYFLGVARFLILEVQKSRTHELMPVMIAGNQDESDQTYSCLEKCVRQLSEADRDLILQFYQLKNRSKVAMRAELAQRLGLSSNALRVRAYRIRRELQTCVEACLKKEND
jgi:DNA-directed RNA polymerase specialized sigma24 family protein